MAKDGKVRIKTTLNPAGMDIENWKALGIDEAFANKQKKVIDVFRKMGVEVTCTCTPYFIGNRPNFGEHIAWGESSAVTFSNSVLGAKTNKEGGPSTIAAALTGRTAEYGLHVEKNRQADFIADVKTEIKGVMLFGALGNTVGKKSKGKIPLIKGIKNADEDELKALSASIVTYGGAAMFHIEGITPNKTKIPNETITITKNDIDNAINEMNDYAEPDFVFIGCPHCSIDEMEKISKLLKNKKVKIETWIGVSRQIKKLADERGYTKIIESSGAKIACDTCHVVAPLKGRFKCMATNSAKGVYYGRGKNAFKTVFTTLEGCIEKAVRR
jgi:predicted aconitase